jgi:hypothetical protein
MARSPRATQAAFDGPAVEPARLAAELTGMLERLVTPVDRRPLA